MTAWIRRFFGATAPDRERQDLTPEDLQARADTAARSAGLSGAEEAFRQLDAGRLDGTLLEMELRMIRFLRREDGNHAPRETATA